MRIIAMSGKAAAGKDTAALALKNRVSTEGGTCQILPFADDLKRIVSQLWSVDEGYLKTYEGKATLRSKLIQLGGFVRDIDPGTWVQLVINKIKALPRETDLVVIPDLRFLNELYKLLSEFGTDVILVRVVSPANVRMERMGQARAKEYVDLGIHTDVSERQFDFLEKPAIWFDQETLPAVQELQAYAHFIQNDGSFEDLERAVAAWVIPSFSKEKAQAAMKASYVLSKRLGPEAKLVLGM